MDANQPVSPQRSHAGNEVTSVDGQPVNPGQVAEVHQRHQHLQKVVGQGEG